MLSGKELGDAIARAIQLKGVQQKDVADEFGVKRPSVSGWIKSGRIDKRHIAHLVEYFSDVVGPEHWGLTSEWDPSPRHPGVAESRPTYQLADDDEVAILQYDTGGRGGPGLVLRDQPGVIQRWSVSTDWLRANVPHYTSASNLYIVTGFGDSMPDTYNPGDPVLVDTGVTVCDHDGVYFFRVEHEGFIKRLQRIPGQGIRVLSQNKEYEPWTITPDMDFQVFGKVLKAWKGKTY